MQDFEIHNNYYISPERKVSFFARIFPSLCFYLPFLGIVFRSARQAKRGIYDDEVWRLSSLQVFQLLEQVGVRFTIDGFEHLRDLDGPCVLVGNHMSIMETVVLPCLVLPFFRVTFVVKKSLLTYPVFKYVMRSRNPVAVTRSNPRADFKTVMNQGSERLADGISIIVFPQTTRAHRFDAENFGSIGTKLAKKAKVPVVPVAVKTDAWANGTLSKDFGRICPEIPVRISFGKPLRIEGKGGEQQREIAAFIEEKLAQWQ